MKRLPSLLIALFSLVWLTGAGWLPLAGTAPAGGGTTAWNPADAGTGLTTSNGNLTVTNGAGFANTAIRAVASHTTGKYYYETHLDSSVSLNFLNQGFGNASAGLALQPGSDANAMGYQPGSGPVRINSSIVATIQTSAVGDTLCLAIDLTNSKLWIRTNGGNWNNDILANQNPATNTGGIPFTGLNAGPYFPMAGLVQSPDAITSNFGATAYAQAVPSGFGNW